MIKSELVQKIAEENPHLYQRDVERLVETIFGEITSALSEGRRAELRGFGDFSVKLFVSLVMLIPFRVLLSHVRENSNTKKKISV